MIGGGVADVEMAATTGATPGTGVDGVAAAPGAETDMRVAAATLAVAAPAAKTDVVVAGAMAAGATLDAEADAGIAAALAASAASKEYGGGGGSSLSSL
jgi:hypothetical protein